MIYLLFVFIITFSSQYAVNGDGAPSCPSSFENGRTALDIEDLHVEWRIDEALGVADFYLSSPSTGGSTSWVAIGFSEAGGMVGSDIVSVQYFADS
eukprot:CAMPEP_0114426162 /NCGR_PEP_ID=MMETSP0103-20121206/7641_1 /TAXON_ID=37642 ORGANISM="Paraphysomonas imperforata, Strain PA2" /NCGR_SAMPLE_ID=MMETSP0103 /ASSEMBLY_ACC=CAM_ASM_000201 /LENGTH=95 /DNA_ID=CAMNT_0001595085 /DNA_START=85 /DNA_END=368 /DNA_ORIENTATION=-